MRAGRPLSRVLNNEFVCGKRISPEQHTRGCNGATPADLEISAEQLEKNGLKSRMYLTILCSLRPIASVLYRNRFFLSQQD